MFAPDFSVVLVLYLLENLLTCMKAIGVAWRSNCMSLF